MTAVADADQLDLLEALAEQQAVVDAVASTPAHKADPEFELFIDACRHDAYTHGGFVSQNRVRKALSNDNGLTVNPRRYSGFWARAKAQGYLSKSFTEEDNRDKRGRNLGKKSKIHRWLPGSSLPTSPTSAKEPLA